MKKRISLFFGSILLYPFLFIIGAGIFLLLMLVPFIALLCPECFEQKKIKRKQTFRKGCKSSLVQENTTDGNIQIGSINIKEK